MKALPLPQGGRYEIHDGFVVTVFTDGQKQSGIPRFDEESAARARALGYHGSDTEAVWAMTRDHDLLHSLVAHAIDESESHALRWHIDGRREPGRVPLEERLVFLVQRALQASSVEELCEEP